MPGADRNQVDRIEAGWYRRGFEDGADGRKESGPSLDDSAHAASMGLDTAGPYHRGYLAGCEQYEQEAER